MDSLAGAAKRAVAVKDGRRKNRPPPGVTMKKNVLENRLTTAGWSTES